MNGSSVVASQYDPLATIDISSAELCRENGWNVGDLLEGFSNQATPGPLIRLVEIGPFEVAAEILRFGDLKVRSSQDATVSASGNLTCELFLTRRSWKKL